MQEKEEKKTPTLDITKHPFLVRFNPLNRDGNTNNIEYSYDRRYSNLICACRTLVHYSYFEGQIVDMSTGIMTNLHIASMLIKGQGVV